MMSDLALVGCYNTSYMSASERNRVMLASAKRNLAAMAFFALTEYQKVSPGVSFFLTKMIFMDYVNIKITKKESLLMTSHNN